MATPQYHLIEGEFAILRALEDGRWRTSVEIADNTEIAGFAVRGLLNNLRRNRLVESGTSWKTVGEWSITEGGGNELRARRQLKLIDGGLR